MLILAAYYRLPKMWVFLRKKCTFLLGPFIKTQTSKHLKYFQKTENTNIQIQIYFYFKNSFSYVNIIYFNILKRVR